MNSTVGQLLQNKKIQGVISICPEASTYEGLEMMAKHDIGALAVLEENQIIGILSERDYARKIVLEGKTSMQTPVKETMTTSIVKVSPSTSLEECTQLMTNNRVRYLAVMENNSFTALISIGDVVKAVMTEQQSDIENLQGYIQSQ
jgi:CBS domain-containing protein